MNYLDIVLGALLIIGIIRGFFKGLIMSAFSLAGFVLGIYLSIKMGSAVGGWLSKFIHTNPDYLNIGAFLLIFIVIQIICLFLGKLLESLAETIELGFANKILGAFFGLFKTAVILSLLIILFNTFFGNDKLISRETRNGSFIYGPVSKTLPMVFPGLAEFKFDIGKTEVVLK